MEHPNVTFDLVHQSTVFTSILDPATRRRTAEEMVRVLKPDGLILRHDYHVNNPSNPDVHAVSRREIHALLPVCSVAIRPLTLAPPPGGAHAGHGWPVNSLSYSHSSGLTTSRSSDHALRLCDTPKGPNLGPVNASSTQDQPPPPGVGFFDVVSVVLLHRRLVFGLPLVVTCCRADGRPEHLLCPKRGPAPQAS